MWQEGLILPGYENRRLHYPKGSEPFLMSNNKKAKNNQGYGKGSNRNTSNNQGNQNWNQGQGNQGYQNQGNQNPNQNRNQGNPRGNQELSGGKPTRGKVQTPSRGIRPTFRLVKI